jgi:hypothetical protein
LPTILDEFILSEGKRGINVVLYGHIVVADIKILARRNLLPDRSEFLGIYDAVWEGNVVFVWNYPFADLERHLECREGSVNYAPTQTVSSVSVLWVNWDPKDGYSYSRLCHIGVKLAK